MKIKVTKEDIKNGCRYNMFRCPVALALRRCFPDSAVGNRAWYANSQAVMSMNSVEKLPKSVIAFIERFDDHKRVKPFTFDLPAPEPVASTTPNSPTLSKEKE